MCLSQASSATSGARAIRGAVGHVNWRAALKKEEKIGNELYR